MSSCPEPQGGHSLSPRPSYRPSGTSKPQDEAASAMKTVNTQNESEMTRARPATVQSSALATAAAAPRGGKPAPSTQYYPDNHTHQIQPATSTPWLVPAAQSPLSQGCSRPSCGQQLWLEQQRSNTVRTQEAGQKQRFASEAHCPSDPAPPPLGRLQDFDNLSQPGDGVTLHPPSKDVEVSRGRIDDFYVKKHSPCLPPSTPASGTTSAFPSPASQPSAQLHSSGDKRNSLQCQALPDVPPSKKSAQGPPPATAQVPNTGASRTAKQQPQDAESVTGSETSSGKRAWENLCSGFFGVRYCLSRAVSPPGQQLAPRRTRQESPASPTVIPVTSLDHNQAARAMLRDGELVARAEPTEYAENVARAEQGEHAGRVVQAERALRETRDREEELRLDLEAAQRKYSELMCRSQAQTAMAQRKFTTQLQAVKDSAEARTRELVAKAQQANLTQVGALKERLSNREEELSTLEERLAEARDNEERLEGSLYDLRSAWKQQQQQQRQLEYEPVHSVGYGDGAGALTLAAPAGGVTAAFPEGGWDGNRGSLAVSFDLGCSPGSSAVLCLQHMLSQGSSEAGFGVQEVELQLERLHQELMRVSVKLAGSFRAPSPVSHATGIGQVAPEAGQGREASGPRLHGHLMQLLEQLAWRMGMLDLPGMPLLLEDSEEELCAAAGGHSMGRAAAVSLSLMVVRCEQCRLTWQLLSPRGGSARQTAACTARGDAFSAWVSSLAEQLALQLSCWAMDGAATPSAERFRGLAQLAAELWVFVKAAHPLMGLMVSKSGAALEDGVHSVTNQWEDVVLQGGITAAGLQGEERSGSSGDRDIVAASLRPGVGFLSMGGAEVTKVLVKESVARLKTVSVAPTELPEPDMDSDDYVMIFGTERDFPEPS